MRNFEKVVAFLLFSTTQSILAQTGNVGINTDVPTNALHVFSTANPLRIEGLQAGLSTDNLLTVDGNGVVKQIPPSGLPAGVKGLLVDTYTAIGTSSVNVSEGDTENIPGASITFTPTVNTTAIITLSSLPVPTNASRPIQGTVDILQNGIKISSQYYSASDGNPNSGINSLVRLGNYVTTKRQVNLNANTTYTFSVQAKSWRATASFNVNPVTGSYVGALASDADAMKTILNISLFTR